MSYTITDGDRCKVRMYSAAQCVLRDDHDYHHVTAGGAHFRGAGRRPVAPKLPESLPAWLATEGGQSFDQWAQDQGIAPASLTWEQQFDVARVEQARTELHDRISAVVHTQNKRDQQRADEFAAFKAGVEKTLEHLADQASRHANTLGALGQTCDRLERTLGQETKKRESLSAELVKTRSGRISPLEDAAAGLRQDLNRLIGMTGDGEVWNEHKQLATSEALLAVSDIVHRRVDDAAQRLNMLEQAPSNHDGRRFERLVKQVQALATENSRLGNRVVELEQRLELPPAAWGHKSAEPPRHQTYQDAEGDLWQCRDGRWFCVREGRSKVWGRGGDGLTWPFGDDCRHYFPWKVWNGRD